MENLCAKCCVHRLTEMNSKEYLEQHSEMVAEKQLRDENINKNAVNA